MTASPREVARELVEQSFVRLPRELEPNETLSRARIQAFLAFCALPLHIKQKFSFFKKIGQDKVDAGYFYMSADSHHDAKQYVHLRSFLLGLWRNRDMPEELRELLEIDGELTKQYYEAREPYLVALAEELGIKDRLRLSLIKTWMVRRLLLYARGFERPGNIIAITHFDRGVFTEHGKELRGHLRGGKVDVKAFPWRASLHEQRQYIDSFMVDIIKDYPEQRFWFGAQKGYHLSDGRMWPFAHQAIDPDPFNEIQRWVEVDFYHLGNALVTAVDH